MGELCQSLPEKLHASTTTIVGPARATAQLADQTDAAPRQMATVDGTLHYPRHIETFATVFDPYNQAAALARRHDLQMHPHKAVLQRFQPLIARLIIARKT